MEPHELVGGILCDLLVSQTVAILLPGLLKARATGKDESKEEAEKQCKVAHVTSPA
jgi:hypothetical protein